MAVSFHVDMDAFYASIEQMDHPEYGGRPIIVGALPGNRGVVSACSYEAREFGVRSAMPISEAYRRCPGGVFLPVRMRRYQEVSARIMEVFADFTPEVQQISVDEAFLDMTGTERLFGPPPDAGALLKRRIRTETGLPASVGIAPNRYLAKLASAASKPDGLLWIENGKEETFVERLPLRDLWGIGTKTLERLSELNIGSVPELKAFSEEELRVLFGKSAGSFLYRCSRGIDPGIFSQEPKSRSVSSETTFSTDTKDREALFRTLLDLSHQVTFRMVREGMRSRTVVLKLRYADFTTVSAQRNLGHWITSAEEVYRAATELLTDRWKGGELIRLLGVGLASLERADKPFQPELFADPYERKKRVELAVLGLHGTAPVPLVKARLLGKPVRKKTGSNRKKDRTDSGTDTGPGSHSP